jgi:hypothetical protein
MKAAPYKQIKEITLTEDERNIIVSCCGHEALLAGG